mmetsp:Transcript_21813/g.39774  ORF Transcript_21813/g.39774 Transcript_21813/m.39774 type:complete len:295 (+) Transcript_21813:21-905(+)
MLNRAKEPWITLALHSTLLILAVVSSPSLLEFESSSVLAYWFVVLATLAGFFMTSCRTPGSIKKAPALEMVSKVEREDISSDHLMKDIKPSTNTNGGTSNRSLGQEPGEVVETTPTPFRPTREFISDPSKSSRSVGSGSSSSSGRFESSPMNTSEIPAVEGDDSSPDEEAVIVVERRFCDRCTLEVPLRAKHCKDCGHCIPLHDHHCPWLGICIGERNRFYFYWYLVLQCTELWWSLVITAISVEGAVDLVNWVEANALRVFCLILLSFFTLMVTCLLCFHTYLALSNRTTCEL